MSKGLATERLAAIKIKRFEGGSVAGGVCRSSAFCGVVGPPGVPQRSSRIVIRMSRLLAARPSMTPFSQTTVITHSFVVTNANSSWWFKGVSDLLPGGRIILDTDCSGDPLQGLTRDLCLYPARSARGRVVEWFLPLKSLQLCVHFEALGNRLKGGLNDVGEFLRRGCCSRGRCRWRQRCFVEEKAVSAQRQK